SVVAEGVAVGMAVAVAVLVGTAVLVGVAVRPRARAATAVWAGPVSMVASGEPPSMPAEMLDGGVLTELTVPTVSMICQVRMPAIMAITARIERKNQKAIRPRERRVRALAGGVIVASVGIRAPGCVANIGIPTADLVTAVGLCGQRSRPAPLPAAVTGCPHS